MYRTLLPFGGLATRPVRRNTVSKEQFYLPIQFLLGQNGQFRSTAALLLGWRGGLRHLTGAPDHANAPTTKIIHQPCPGLVIFPHPSAVNQPFPHQHGCPNAGLCLCSLVKCNLWGWNNGTTTEHCFTEIHTTFYNCVIDAHLLLDLVASSFLG